MIKGLTSRIYEEYQKNLLRLRVGKLKSVLANFESSQPRKIEHKLGTAFNVFIWTVSCVYNPFRSLLMETWTPCFISPSVVE